MTRSHSTLSPDVTGCHLSPVTGQILLQLTSTLSIWLASCPVLDKPYLLLT